MRCKQKVIIFTIFLSLYFGGTPSLLTSLCDVVGAKLKSSRKSYFRLHFIIFFIQHDGLTSGYVTRIRNKNYKLHEKKKNQFNSQSLKHHPGNYSLRGNKVCELCISILWFPRFPSQCTLYQSQLICFSSG